MRADIFGVPGKGVHAHSVFGLAAVDLGATVLVAAGVGAAIAHSSPGRNTLAYVFLAIIAFILAGVAAHEYVGVDTRLNAKIFGRPWPATKR
jgi:hypothetical protein